LASTRDAEIYLSRPGLGVVPGARLLAEFGDDTTRYPDARSRKNYAGTSPITRQSGKKKTVLARYVHNDRLIDALNRQAFAALRASPGARAHYDQLPARGVGHHAALRQLGNRLVGIPPRTASGPPAFGQPDGTWIAETICCCR
jgi:transposase